MSMSPSEISTILNYLTSTYTAPFPFILLATVWALIMPDKNGNGSPSRLALALTSVTVFFVCSDLIPRFGTIGGATAVIPANRICTRAVSTSCWIAVSAEVRHSKTSVW